MRPRQPFPTGFSLVSGDQVTLYTGSGSNLSSELHWRPDSAIWNNGGDRIVVLNGDGRVFWRGVTRESASLILSKSMNRCEIDELSQIRQAIESVPEEVFFESESGREVKEFDRRVGQNLPDYSLEGSDGCVLWEEEGFSHSVDLYHPEKRIAVELEKSERKYVWKDLAKFGRGAHIEVDGRKKVEFGCLVVPDYYSGSTVFSGTRKMLRFMEPMLDLDEIIIIGFSKPTSE